MRRVCLSLALAFVGAGCGSRVDVGALQARQAELEREVAAANARVAEARAEMKLNERILEIAKARCEFLERERASSNVTVATGPDGLCWILARDGRTEVKKGVDIDRYVLCAYRMVGSRLDLASAREVSYDVKLADFRGDGYSRVRDAKEELLRRMK